MKHQADLVIRNGLVYDGTGAEPFEADIAVRAATQSPVGRIDTHHVFTAWKRQMRSVGLQVE